MSINSMYTWWKVSRMEKNVNKWMYEWHDVISLFETFLYTKRYIFIFSVFAAALFGGYPSNKYRNLWANMIFFFLLSSVLCLLEIYFTTNNTFKKSCIKLFILSACIGHVEWDEKDLAAIKKFQIYKSRPNYSINLSFSEK
jgi:hypothetical protein